MKNDVTDKSIMRRYLDDMYTQEEARGLLSRLKDDIHAPMLDELATDVGSVVYGDQAVSIGLIDRLGGLSDALSCLHRMIEKQNKKKE